MTVGQLMKILAKANPRSPVAVYVDSFKKPILEHNVITVEAAQEEWLPHVDGDGFQKWRKDGTESGKVTLILRGNHNPEDELREI